jgi:hypothetical protein
MHKRDRPRPDLTLWVPERLSNKSNCEAHSVIFLLVSLASGFRITFSAAVPLM